MFIKMLTEFDRRKNEDSENFNEEMENTSIRKYQIEVRAEEYNSTEK